MKLIPILDNGHGGIIGGLYQTPGKRSPAWSNGILYEGAFNRWIINRIKEELDREGIPYYHISASDKDISLQERVKEANGIFMRNQDKNFYLVSIHANAGGGRGVEVWTSPGETSSDKIATYFMQELKEVLYKYSMPIRSDYTDGDVDMESQFYILRKTFMPALLLELGFMDNPTDYKILWNKKYVEDVSEKIANIIITLYVNGDII